MASDTVPERTIPTREQQPMDWVEGLEGAASKFLDEKLSEFLASPYTKNLLAKDEVQPSLVGLSRSLGHRYANATFATYRIYDDNQRAIVERLKRFAAAMPEHLAQGCGLVLFGAQGTGKDHLLAALLKIAVAGFSLKVRWFDGGELYDAFLRAVKVDSGDAMDKLQAKLREPHILAISDPQPPTGVLTDAQLRRLRDTIDWRYRDGKATWITTNLDNAELSKTILTAPLLDRIKEGAALIDCNWPSHRTTVKATW